MGALGQEERLSEVIREAAFDPSKWRDVCDGFAAISNSIGSVFVPFAMELRTAKIPHSANLEPLVDRYQKHEWYKRELRERGLPAVFKRGFMLDEDCIDYCMIERSDYFQDFLKPVGMKWFAGLGFGNSSNFCVLSLQRPGTGDPFTPDEIEPLMKFRSQVEVSMALATNLEFKKLAGIADFLEHQKRSVIGVNAGGRVTYVSPTAELLIGDAVDIANGWMKSTFETENNALRSLLTALTYPRTAQSDARPIKLSRASGKPPLVVYGYRLPESEFNAFQPAVALLVFVDPEKPQDMPAELFMDYFGFTRAEARLAISLVNGLALDQHAKDGAITIITARNHLQSLLAKTETHSAAALVALLNRVAY